MNQEELKIKVKSSNSDSTMVSRYRSYLHLAPGVMNLIGEGVLASKSVDSAMDNGSPPKEQVIRSASDFSYSANQYSGNRYRIVGDAGGQLI